MLNKRQTEIKHALMALVQVNVMLLCQAMVGAGEHLGEVFIIAGLNLAVQARLLDYPCVDGGRGCKC